METKINFTRRIVTVIILICLVISKLMTINNKTAVIIGYIGVALFMICITWVSVLKLKKFKKMKVVHTVFILRWGSFVVVTACWMLMIQTLTDRSVVLSAVAGAFAAAFTLINLVVNVMQQGGRQWIRGRTFHR